MAKTGMEILMAADTTPEELAKILGNGHPPFTEEGLVHCDNSSCEECWLAWLTTGKPPIPTK